MSEPFHLSDFLPYRLAVLAERVSHRLAVEYERMHGLSVAEWRVLVHVQRAGMASVRDIHEFANLGKPKVSRAVTRLETRGFVRKITSSGDGRLVEISLTEKGASALSEIIPVVSRIEARLLSALTPDQSAALTAAMEALHQDLDADPEAKPRAALDTPDP